MWTDPTFWAALPSTLFGLACILASVGWVVAVVRADLDESGDGEEGADAPTYRDLT